MWSMKIARTGLIPLAQDYFLDDTPLFHWEEESAKKGSQAERTFAKMCSVPTHRLTDPISDWNYLWTGINRLFDYEPGWHKKVTNMTKMQLMNFFVTLGSGKLQCDAHHIHKWQSAAVGDGELSGDRCLLSVPELQAWSCLALSPFVVRLILVFFF